MSCGFDREIIHKYVDNTIDPLEFIFLKEHMNYCGECRRELDTIMTLENELEKFFDDDTEVKDLDLLIANLVDDCMDELSRKEKVKYAFKRSLKIGNRIRHDTMRFIDYIPGKKYIGKGVKKSASITGNLMVSLIRKSVVKLLEM